MWKGHFRTPGVVRLKRKARPSLLETVKCCIIVHSVVLSFYSFNVVFWERNCNVYRESNARVRKELKLSLLVSNTRGNYLVRRRERQREETGN